MKANKVRKIARPFWHALSTTRKQALLMLKSALVIAFTQSVSAEVLFSDDYSEFNQQDYTINSGDWKVSNNGTLVKSETSGAGSITTGNPLWSDYTTSVRLKTLQTGETWEVARLAVRVSGNNFYQAFVKRNGVLVFKSSVNGQASVLFTASTTVDPLQWYTLSIALEGSAISVSVNGEEVRSVSNTDHSAGEVSFSSHVKARFDDLLVVGDETPDQEITGLNSFFMGHSFFRPVADLLPEQTEIAGLSDHTQQVYFSGGQTGTPDNLWLDPTSRANVQSILDGGGIEQIGMVPAYDGGIDAYINWIQYALERNPLRRVFIAMPWATYPLQNLTTRDQFQDGHRNVLHGQIDTLRSTFPDLDIFCLPYGLTGFDLDDLWFSGDLPELTQHTGQPEETSVRTDDKGHGGTMLKQYSVLMWLGSLYHVDLNQHDFETDYPSTDLKQMAMDLINDHDVEYRATPLTTTPPPADGAYYDYIYDASEITAHNGIVYATKTETNGNTPEDLKMNVYVSPNSELTQAPLIVVVHGGGFKSGDENKGRFPEYATNYARMGFVGASITYRKSNPVTGDTITNALWDVEDAIRYLKVNAASYGINPNKIIVLGASAGGFATHGLAIGTESALVGLDPERAYPNTSSQISGAVTTGAVMVMNPGYEGLFSYEATDSPMLILHNGVVDQELGTTWAQALELVDIIIASGNTATAVPHDQNHTSPLGPESPEFEDYIHPFILENLGL